jgi:hypothetical protein
MSVPPVQPGLSYAATGTRPEPAAIVGNGGGHGVASTAAASEAAIQAATLDPLMAALADALGAAAVRQKGLAPLFANLEVLLARADLPEAVRTAAQALNDLRLSDAALNSGTLRQAVSRSGLFVEAVQAKGLTPDINIKSALQNLSTVLLGLLGTGSSAAAAVSATPLSASAHGTAPAPSLPLPLALSSPAPALLADADVRQAATLVLTETEAALAATPGSQRPAGQPALAADLEALLARPGLPEPVRNAVQALLTLRLSGAAPDDVARQTPGASGLPAGAGWPDMAMTDAVIKVALQNLRDTLKGMLGADGAPAEKRAAPLPPPFRGALPVAQPPVPATIAGAGLREAATTVLAQADAAIARHVMLQIASLPASQQPSHPPDDHTQRLVLDIPLVTPQGTTIVQVQIERDAPQREAQAPIWSVRFAVEMEPLGPVRARVAQIGGRTSVTLVAEKPDSAAALQKDIGTLKAALSQANLEPGDLHCLSHDQTKVTAPQGQFVNRAS